MAFSPAQMGMEGLPSEPVPEADVAAIRKDLMLDLEGMSSADTSMAADSAILSPKSLAMCDALPAPILSPDEQQEMEEEDITPASPLPPKDDVKPETMKVYLRVRPFAREEVLAGEDKDILRVMDAETVFVNAPAGSKAAKNKSSKGPATYSFSKVFGERTSQEVFFENTTRPMVKELLDGQNCLMFTYGVTNAGKTFTVQGTPEEQGILPRALDVVFNSVAGQQWTETSIRPKHFSEVAFLASEAECEAQQRAKDDCLDMSRLFGDVAAAEASTTANTANSTTTVMDTTTTTVSSTNSSSSLLDSATTDTASTDASVDLVEDSFDFSARRLREEFAFPVRKDCRYAIFLSYAEIYNEYIYDLLVRPPKRGKRQQSCRLAEDGNKDIFIRNLTEVQVNSIEEAFQVLTVGRRNRRVAATVSNVESSRSHCVFTLKVVRVPDVSDPHYASVSRLSIVDLAGSERYSKTNATGARLKEAGNINTSLLTLGKCIEAVRWNQTRAPSSKRLVPFRESKLTQLFRNYLSGKGRVRMTVNVSRCASAFDETVHVLKFSAIARKVASAPVAARIDTRLAPTGSRLEKELTADLEGLQAYNQSLVHKIQQLQAQMVEMEKRTVNLETEIRDEVAAEMAEQLVEMQLEYQNMLHAQADTAEARYENKMTLLTHSIKRDNTRKRILTQQQSLSVTEKAELNSLRSQVAELQETCVELQESCEEHHQTGIDLRELLLSAENKAADGMVLLERERDQSSRLQESLSKKCDAIYQMQEKLDVAEQSRAEAAASHTKVTEAMSLQISALEETNATLKTEMTAAHMARQVAETAAEAAQQTQIKSAASAAAALEAERRTVVGLQETIESLHRQLAVLEQGDSELKQQLADMMEEEMDRQLNSFANTSAGAELQRGGSIVSNSGKPLAKRAKRSASSDKKTRSIDAAAAIAAAAAAATPVSPAALLTAADSEVMAVPVKNVEEEQQFKQTATIMDGDAKETKCQEEESVAASSMEEEALSSSMPEVVPNSTAENEDKVPATIGSIEVVVEKAASSPAVPAKAKVKKASSPPKRRTRRTRAAARAAAITAAASVTTDTAVEAETDKENALSPGAVANSNNISDSTVNAEALLPLAKQMAKKASTKRPRRKLGKKNTAASPMAPLVRQPSSRMDKLLTPIARRLRRRRGAEA